MLAKEFYLHLNKNSIEITMIDNKPTGAVFHQLIDDHCFEYFHEHKYEINWDKLSIYKNMSVDFMREFKDNLNWELVNMYGHSIDESLIEELVAENKITWVEISEYQYDMSEDFIRKHWNDLEKYWLAENYVFSNSFMREFKDYFDIFEYIKLGRASREFLEEMKDYIIQNFDKNDWNYIALYDLPIHYYEVFRDQLDWEEVSKSNVQLSADFINKFGRYLNWTKCVQYKYMKMKFIKKYWKRFNFNWKYLCSYQQLSEEFIRKHADKICWEELTFSNSLPINLIEDMIPYFNEKCWSNISGRQRLTSDFVFKHLEQINLPAFVQNYKIRWNKDHALYALELIDRKRTGL